MTSDKHQEMQTDNHANDDQQLDLQLQQWYQQSKATHPMPEGLKQQFNTTEPTKNVINLEKWRRRSTEWLALAACALMVIFWQKPELLLYKIDQVQQQDTMIVVHYLGADNASAEEQVVSSNTKRQHLYQQAYRDYLQSSQLTAAQHEQVFWRENVDAGWQLKSCDAIVLQINHDLLKRMQQEQPEHWQQLEQSQFVALKFGQQGQILAIKHSVAAPNCTAI